MLDTTHAFKDEYFFLSNMFLVPIVYKGRVYGSSESAYQAQKCAKDEDKNAFMYGGNPYEAKKLGKKVERRIDFEDIKLEVMKEILTIKFRIPELRKQLLDTGDLHLEEANYWGDMYWGTCRGVGENHLGRILMEIREEIRSGK